ncbi:MAG: hypothetical protein WKF96_21290, partial [Solirubrobacteraceae bacterium]
RWTRWPSRQVSTKTGELHTVDGKEWLVHERLLEHLGPASAVMLVGVAEQALFWKDLRRLLFSRSRYLVLARVARDGLHARWDPVKSLGVLEEIAPQVAAPLRQAVEALPGALDESQSTEAPEAPPAAVGAMVGVLADYAEALAVAGGHTYPDPARDLIEHGIIELASLGDAGAEERRRAFASVAEHVRGRFGVPVDPQRAANLRQDLQQRAGLWPPVAGGGDGAGPGPGAIDVVRDLGAARDDVSVGGRDGDSETEGAGPQATRAAAVPHGEEQSMPPGVGAAASSRRYLDAEIVAVYW